MRLLLLAASLCLAAALGAASTRAQIPPVVEFQPPPPPEQPIAYSHKTHLALGLDCQQCHDGAAKGARANIPTSESCMSCHSAIKAESPEIKKLAAVVAAKEEVPWKRVYRVPDFVYFEHARHVAVADVTCETCHGAVRDLAVMQKLKDTSMAACVQCHTQRAAPTRCDTCHEQRG